MGVACERARVDLDTESERVRALRDLLWESLRGQISQLAMNGHRVERLPNTLSVSFPGVSGIALLAAIPGLAASTGSACHGGEEQAPQIVVAMGVPPREALSEAWRALSHGRPLTDGGGRPDGRESS